MNIFERMFPGFAIKRAYKLNQLKRMKELGKLSTRNFEAIAGGRNRDDFIIENRSADSAVYQSTQALSGHIRQLEYNNGNVSGGIRRVTNNTIGNGFRLQVRAGEDQDFNLSVERWWKLWVKQADVRLLNTFHTLTRLAFTAAFVRDGASIAVGRISKRLNRHIPYCLELYEIDRLVTPPGEMTNPKIRNGIRYDNEGAPVAVYLYKVHPGDVLAGYNVRPDDIEEVPWWNKNGTQKVIYLYDPTRAEQTVGFSELAPALKDIQDADRYKDAEKIAALEDACMTGIVYTENPQDFQNNYTETSKNTQKYERINEFAPNKWHYLAPGQKADIRAPNRPNDAFESFLDALDRGVASAVDVPPEIWNQNWKDMNYSNARTVLAQLTNGASVRQKMMMDYWCHPIYQNVLMGLIATGKIRSGRFFKNIEIYSNSDKWIPMVTRKPIDSAKEAKGREIDLNSGSETLDRVWAEQGEDWEEQMEQQARILVKKKELEERYDISFNAETQEKEEEPEEEEEESSESKKEKKVLPWRKRKVQRFFY